MLGFEVVNDFVNEGKSHALRVIAIGDNHANNIICSAVHIAHVRVLLHAQDKTRQDEARQERERENVCVCVCVCACVCARVCACVCVSEKGVHGD